MNTAIVMLFMLLAIDSNNASHHNAYPQRSPRLRQVHALLEVQTLATLLSDVNIADILFFRCHARAFQNGYDLEIVRVSGLKLKYVLSFFFFWVV